MDLLGMADPAALSSDALTGLAFGIIKILAFGGMAVVGIRRFHVVPVRPLRMPEMAPRPGSDGDLADDALSPWPAGAGSLLKGSDTYSSLSLTQATV